MKVDVSVTSINSGDIINNHTNATILPQVDRDILSLSGLDDEFIPVTVSGFQAWNHAISINNKSVWFCESL